MKEFRREHNIHSPRGLPLYWIHAACHTLFLSNKVNNDIFQKKELVKHFAKRPKFCGKTDGIVFFTQNDREIETEPVTEKFGFNIFFLKYIIYSLCYTIYIYLVKMVFLFFFINIFISKIVLCKTIFFKNNYVI